MIVATNENDILARALATGEYRPAGRQADAIAVDGHSGVVQFRAAAVRAPTAATPSGVRGLMAALKQSGGFAIPEDALAAHPRAISTPSAAPEAECASEMARAWRESGVADRSAYGGRRPRGARGAARATRRRRSSRWRPPIPPNSPTRSRRRPACGPPLPPHLADLMQRPERFDAAAQRRRAPSPSICASTRGRGLERAPHHACRRACASSPTPSPHLRTAALGLFVAAGSRNERDEEHGLSHLLEHMAFKGTGRRNAREIAEAIENVGGDLNAETGVEQTGYFAHVLKEDVGLALDLLADIYCDSRFDAAGAGAREERHRAGDRRGRGHARRSRVRPLSAAAWRRSGDRPADPRHARDASAASIAAAIDAYLQRHYRAGATLVVGAGAVDHDELVARSRDSAGGARRRTSRPAPTPARYTGGESLTEERRWSRPISSSPSPAAAIGDEDHDAAQVFAAAVGGGMSSPLFQEVREKRGLAYAIHAFHWALRRRRACSASTPAAPPRTPAN